MPKKLCLTFSTLALLLFFIGVFTVQESPAQNGETPLKQKIEERKNQIEKFKNNPELAEEIKNKPLSDKIHVRGQKVDFDVPPVVQDGRTLIPVRAVSEALDADVDWLAEEQKVVIEKGNKVIEMVLGQKDVSAGGQSYELDVPARAVEGRTMVPLRFVSEIMGDNVQYHPETDSIDIALDNAAPEVGEDLNPAEVVNKFWSLYIQGEQEKANQLVVEEKAEQLGDWELGSEEIDEQASQILERFDLQAVDYQVNEDTAVVDIELTMPNLQKAFQKYYDTAMDELSTMYEEGADEEEISAKAEELMIEIFQEVETVTFEEKAELHLVDGNWKIYEWQFENMQEKWSQLDEEL